LASRKGDWEPEKANPLKLRGDDRAEYFHLLCDDCNEHVSVTLRPSIGVPVMKAELPEVQTHDRAEASSRSLVWFCEQELASPESSPWPPDPADEADGRQRTVLRADRGAPGQLDAIDVEARLAFEAAEMAE
jgi:hypothetical protein